MDNLSLDSKNWKTFFIEDVAAIISGQDIYEKERINGHIPYITATANNNGIGYFVANKYNRENETCTILKRNEQIFSFFASFFLLLFRPLKHHFNAD